VATLRASRTAVSVALRDPHTVKAAGLAGAQLAANGVALVLTIVFARLLGTEGYGELARLIAVLVILQVPCSAMQVSAARETALHDARAGDERAATLARRVRSVLVLVAAVVIVSVIAREPLASAMRVDSAWATAAVPVTAALWLLLAVQRGTLQGMGIYRPVAVSLLLEQVGRLAFGVGLVAAGGSVAGAFFGTSLAVVAVGAWLGWQIRRRLGRRGGASASSLRSLAMGGWTAILALTLLAMLQNLDVVVVGHTFSSETAGAYATAAIAAKGIIWVAVGLGLYLLPEATRQVAARQDARPILFRTLALLGAVALPMVTVYAIAGHEVLRVVFGGSATLAASALPLLAIAMSLLAASYLATQALLAADRARFIWLLAIAAAAELVLLATVRSSLVAVAVALTALQLLLAGALLSSCLRRARPSPVVPQSAARAARPASGTAR
jgi:O-antigen/teichoic acid export membrane protein